jgi:hypothetical protein
MTKPGKLDRFDAFIPAHPPVNPWQRDGSYRSDLSLLERLLAVAVGTSQQSGVVAGAADVWAAEELRRAGFDPDEVWPRRTPPRVMPRDVRNFVDLALTKRLRDQVEARFDKPGARKALPAEAHVMGRAYSKQSDVVIASWAAGVELLISTKTMLSSYQKNLRNRFEEGYGDAKNLRGRHPLAALGFLFITGSDIPDSSLLFAVDMLQKLTSEPDVYDCACLLVIDGAQGAHEEASGDERAVNDEPSALLVHEATGEAGDDADEIGPEHEVADNEDDPDLRRVSVLQDRCVPPDLGTDHFFEVLISRALERMPVAVYSGVRRRRAEVLGSPP